MVELQQEINTQNKSRKILICAGILVIAILIVATISYFLLASKKTDINIESDSDMAAFLGNEKNLAVLSENPEICDEEDLGEQMGYFCYIILAVNENKPGYCEKLNSKSIGEESSQYCEYLVENCNKNNTTKETCLKYFIDSLSQMKIQEKYELLSNVKSESECENEENETWRGICYQYLAVNTGKVLYCNKALDIKSCKYDVAIKTGNESLCLEVYSNKTEDCYYRIAINFGKLNLCIKTGKAKYYCIREASSNENATFKKEDILICTIAKEETNSVIPAECYYNVADKTGADTCELLENSDRTVCYSSYAKNTGDVKACAKLSSTPTNSEPRCGDACDCLYYVAEKIQNPEDCELFGELIVKQTCYDYYATKNENADPSYCEKTDNPDWCYDGVYYRTGDASICGKVKNLADAYHCRMRI